MAKKEYTPAEAAAMGVGWVDTNNANYGTKGYVGYGDAAGGAPDQVGTGNVGVMGPVAQDGTSYTATPGAAPAANTANQGAQDVYRNKLIEQASQDTHVDTNDPTFRGIADNNAAAQERARRNATDMANEGMAAQGMGSSGAMDNEARYQTEKAAQASSGFESQLALSELQNKRSEIANALQGLGTTISGDQARALTERLAQLDATIKREGNASASQLGNAQISEQHDSGVRRDNLAALGLGYQNQWNNNNLGFNYDQSDRDNDNAAIRAALGL